MMKYCSKQAIRMEKPANTHTMSAAKRSSLEIRPLPLPVSMAHRSPDVAAAAASERRSVNKDEGLNGPHSS